jgi:7-cyano-7-deazaguanine synthase
LARHYDVEHRIVDLRWLGELGGSALTDRSKAVPELKSTELDQMNTITQTAAAVWIPNRNGVLIQVAAAFAERRGAEQVVVGFNREEATTFPDNTVDFLERSTRALELSTSTQVRVACYTATFDKTEIVRALRSLKSPQTEFPFGKIWSCYEGADEPCGRCESCQRLKRALGNSRSGGGES